MSGGLLAGLRVLDFSTSLPGPLATLMLADAGAEVIKIERPDGGDPARADPAVFAILNRAKRSIAIDLKRDAALLDPLIASADILVEQFRPGVMDRLGLGHEAVRARNPRLIYASINGYGSDGPDAQRPGHDLTYVAESGLLSLNADSNGDPVVPAALAADVAGGSYSAVAQIMMALFHRERTGEGSRLDIALFAGLMPFLNEAFAHAAEGRAVAPGYSPATGGSERYALYRTADGRHLALACPEEKFWLNFCEAAELSPSADREAIAARLAERTAAHWLATFAGRDLCCSLVATVAEALDSPRVQGLIGAGFVPLVAPAFRAHAATTLAPALGEANASFLGGAQ
ncbi:MAG: CoA transferase [Sphingomicrobium sp.]